MESFNAAYAQSNLMYKTSLNLDDFEEIGLIAWNKIGNRVTRLYRYTAKAETDGTNYFIDLPCNCLKEDIEAITYGYEDWNYSTNQDPNGDYSSQFTENYIEGRKMYEDPLYASGKYAKYWITGNTIYFDHDYDIVNILYKGVLVDDDGLPELNTKEVEAIACYCAHIEKFRLGWATNNLLIILLAQLLELKWLKLCDAARIPIKISQNDMNKILDAKSSWNRKLFNKSYKPVK